MQPNVPTVAEGGSQKLHADETSPPYADSALACMRAARRWLISTPEKIPFYIDGQPRQGALDAPDDVARFGSYEEAKAALSTRPGWLLGFALGPDSKGGHWQGVDLDDVEANCLGVEANVAPGYVELSPSGLGQHAIGYGKHFAVMGANNTGVEAYAAGRYFTVTERPIRDGALVCLALYVEQVLAPRHVTRRAPAATENVNVDPQTVTELRSALAFLRADDREQWIACGHALKELGEVGRGMWLEWSQSSEKYDPVNDPKKWDTFRATRTGYQAVFKRAQERGWVNPASSAARVEPRAATTARQLKGRSLNGVAMRAIDWLWCGWIPKGYITIFAGETGAGKTTVIADIVARISTGAPWPGAVGTSAASRAPGRVLWLGSEDSIEEMTIPRLTACGARLENVIEIEGVVQDGKRSTFSMQDDLEAVGAWLKHARGEGNPFVMLVIDPVTSYLPGNKLRKVDLNDAGQLRTILEPWLNLAQEHRIAIVCVTHFGKDTTRSMLHRVLGSAAFAQTCRSLCAVMDRPASEDYEPGPHEKLLMQVKVNLPEHPGGAWIFSTERLEVGRDPENDEPIFATRPDWGELDAALTPASVVGRARGPRSQSEKPFAIWLRATFAPYPPGHWLEVETVKWSAVRDVAATESWWSKHSSDHLERQNVGGKWMCRPKPGPN